MENGRSWTYRQNTPMVILRPERIVERSGKSNSVLFEFDKWEDGKKVVRWLPRRLIDIWIFREGEKRVVEIQLPKWLAEKERLI